MKMVAFILVPLMLMTSTVITCWPSISTNEEFRITVIFWGPVLAFGLICAGIDIVRTYCKERKEQEWRKGLISSAMRKASGTNT